MAGGGPTNIDALVPGLDSVTKVLGASNGDVYFVSSSRSQVLRVTPSGQLYVVAGAGTASFWGDGAAAQSAALNTPTGIAFDASGNLFIADSGNHVIRRVDALSGIITTIAGTPVSSGNTGDGGAALSAKLSSPGAVAVDSRGRVFVSDSGNNRVRMLTPSGGNYTISHYAGLAAGTAGTGCEDCAAATAALSVPLGLGLDGSGNLFIADSANHLIRRVDAVSLCVTTVAGIAPGGNPGYSGGGIRATQSKLNSPADVVVDGQGNLYIADQANHLIRYVSFSNANPVQRLMTDFAGVAQSGGYNGDGAAATQKLQSPAGVGLDWSGRVLVADKSNYRIRAVTVASAGAGGTVTTIAGSGQAMSAYFGDGVSALSVPILIPRGLAVDSSGAVYAAESYTLRVRRIDPNQTQAVYAGNGSAGTTDGPATSSPLSSYLRGLAIDGDGNLFIADVDNGAIRRVDAVTKAMTTLTFSSGSRSVSPYDLAYNPTTHLLYVSDNVSCVIWQADPVALTASVYAGQIGKCLYGGDGGLATSATLGTLAYNGGLYGIALDASGALYLAQPYDSVIRRIDPVTHIITRFAGDGTGIAGRSGDGGPAASARLNGPWGVAADAAGNVYISDFLNHSIRKVDAGGTISTIAGDGTPGFSGDGGPASAARLFLPTFLATDSAGRLYVDDSGSNRVRVIQTCTPSLSSSGITLASGSASFTVTAPAGCVWTATSAAPWLNGLPRGGRGNGTVSFSVGAPSASARSAAITVGGQSYTVTQSAAACTVSFNPLSPGSIGAAGGAATLGIGLGGYDCSWSASSSASWITRLPRSGKGSATLNFTVAENLNTNARSGTISVNGQTYTLSQAGTGCTVSFNPLSPVSVAGGGANLSVAVATSSPGCAWTVSPSADWITNVTPTSGTGSLSVTYAVVPNSGAARSGSLGVLGQNYTINQAAGGADTTAPIGTMDTPIDGTTNVYGAIGVTGWALDNVGVSKVEIYRNPVGGETGGTYGWIYIGDANFVSGARPDVAVAYPGYPNNARGGWGYQLLTNFLPGSGNGTVKLHAVAYDAAGNHVELGSGKTITCNNAAAVKPFGTIDTPSQGGTASGPAYVNFGWALTPGAGYTIPTNGCSIKVFLDGAPLGCPAYNNARSDISTLFPGYTNSGGAVGYYFLDTTQFPDGAHTIAWIVRDDASRADGLGSRYFTIRNSLSTLTALPGRSLMAMAGARVRSLQAAGAMAGRRLPAGQLFVRRGDVDTPLEELLADSSGRFHLTAEQYERLELHLGAVRDGYLAAADAVLELPVGSVLDPDSGIYYWQTGAPFLGEYELHFMPDGGADPVRVVVEIVPQRFGPLAARADATKQ